MSDSKTLREQLNEAQAKLVEAREACPVLFAEKGDVFEHDRADGIHDLGPDKFVFLGRTTGSSKSLEDISSSDNKKKNHVTPAGWLIFQHIAGTGCGIANSYGAINGGVRDVIGAWPCGKYNVYDEDGQYDPTIFCLPPSKVYGFRKASKYPFDEEGDY